MIGRIFSRQPALVGSASAAVYIALAMIYRAFFAHTGVFAPDELGAAIAAVYALWARTVVTPLALPRSRTGAPLVTLGKTPPAAEHWPQ